MNLDYYKNFIAVAEAGTISAAAKKILIAQPALSNQIKYLEDKFGAPLFVRGSRRLELTDAGQVLYNKLKAICHLEESAITEIRACVDGSKGTLWLGTTPAYPDSFFTGLLMDFHKEYPGISFEIFEQNSNQIIQLLKDNIIEVGLVRTKPSMSPQMRTITTMSEQMMAYYHRDHPLLNAKMERVPISLLKNAPISIAKGFRENFSSACQYEGFSPNYLNVCASRYISQFWVADKETVAVIVAHSPFDSGEYCARPIVCRNSITRRSFVVNRERELSAVAQTFIDFCRHHSLVQNWTSEQ